MTPASLHVAPQMEARQPPLLTLQGIEKRFGAVVALDKVSLHVDRGEVLALLGDNGAGKSTLIKCISGVYHIDNGRMLLDGQSVVLHSPAGARAAGVETVYQDLALFDNLDASANFFAGRELGWPTWLPRGLRFANGRRMKLETQTELDRLKVVLPKFASLVGLMSGGQRQAVAVARASTFARRLIILDEPTAALGVRETAKVLDLVVKLREANLAVILITHNMDHVVAIADRAVVMRRGQVVGTENSIADAKHRLVSLIVGAT